MSASRGLSRYGLFATAASIEILDRHVEMSGGHLLLVILNGQQCFDENPERAEESAEDQPLDLSSLFLPCNPRAEDPEDGTEQQVVPDVQHVCHDGVIIHARTCISGVILSPARRLTSSFPTASHGWGTR
jgi:hypothetical protein